MKQRTLSPQTKRKKSKKKTSKSKASAYAVIAANFDPSDAFSKPREPKRLDSVTVDSDEDEQEEEAKSRTKRKDLDKVLFSNVGRC